MKRFMNFIKKITNNRKVKFALDTGMYYVLIMIIYIYLMWANLSTAPDFVYTQF